MFLTVLFNLLYLHYAAFCRGLFEAFDARIFYFQIKSILALKIKLKNMFNLRKHRANSNLLGNERQRAFPFVFNQRSQRARH